MSFKVRIGDNGQIPLPDKLCKELGFEIGNILICVKDQSSSTIIMKKHTDQTLSNDQLELTGNLLRVISYNPD